MVALARRAGLGALLAALAAVGLLVTLSLDWFALALDVPDTGTGILNLVEVRAHDSLTGWSTAGWLMVLLLCVTALAGLALPALTATRPDPTVSWVVAALGAVALVVLAFRLRSLAADQGDVRVEVQLPAYVALVCTAAIAAGALLSLRERQLASAR